MVIPAPSCRRGGAAAVALGAAHLAAALAVPTVRAECPPEEFFAPLQERIWVQGWRLRAMAVGDLDHDGRPDLAVVSPPHNRLTTLVDGTDGIFYRHGGYVGAYPIALALSDFDGDEMLDFVIVHRDDEAVDVYRGNGAGFPDHLATYPVGQDPQAVAVRDLNGDGHADLVVVNQGTRDVSVLLGAEGGAFTDAGRFGVGLGAQALAIGDFDGDGHADVAVTNALGDDVSLLRGRGDGSFDPAVAIPGGGSYPRSIVVHDLDADGALDLAIALIGDDAVSVHFGNGDGTFDAPETHAVGDGPYGLLVADLTADPSSSRPTSTAARSACCARSAAARSRRRT